MSMSIVPNPTSARFSIDPGPALSEFVGSGGMRLLASEAEGIPEKVIVGVKNDGSTYLAPDPLPPELMIRFAKQGGDTGGLAVLVMWSELIALKQEVERLRARLP